MKISERLIEALQKKYESQVSDSEAALMILLTNPNVTDIQYHLDEIDRWIQVLSDAINKTEKLLEFYVSKYVDEYNRTSRLFISDIKKAIIEPDKSTILEFSGVNFITYKCMGVDDFLEFEYEIISFDKIIEYNGFYVVKFIAKVNVNGVDMLEKHRVAELDKKYEQKTKK